MHARKGLRYNLNSEPRESFTSTHARARPEARHGIRWLCVRLRVCSVGRCFHHFASSSVPHHITPHRASTHWAHSYIYKRCQTQDANIVTALCGRFGWMRLWRMGRPKRFPFRGNALSHARTSSGQHAVVSSTPHRQIDSNASRVASAVVQTVCVPETHARTRARIRRRRAMWKTLIPTRHTLSRTLKHQCICYVEWARANVFDGRSGMRWVTMVLWVCVLRKHTRANRRLLCGHTLSWVFFYVSHNIIALLFFAPSCVISALYALTPV